MQEFMITLRQSYDCLTIFDKEAARPEIYPDQKVDTRVWSIVLMKTQYSGAAIVARAFEYER